MNIIWSGQHKSITELEGDLLNLPDFVILTGLNGSGKTHLLESFGVDSASLTDNGDQLLTHQLFNYSSLQPFIEASKGTAIPNETETMWAVIESHIARLQSNLLTQIQNIFGFQCSIEEVESFFKGEEGKLTQHLPEESEINDFRETIFRVVKTVNTSLLKQIDANLKNIQNNIHKARSNATNRPMFSLQGLQTDELVKQLDGEKKTIRMFLEIVEHNSSLPLILIDWDQFQQAYPVDVVLDPFSRSITSWFRRYLKKYSENSRARDMYDLLGGDKKHLESDEFKAMYGDFPWEVLNSLFSEAGLDFEISKPSSSENLREFQAEIRDVTTKSVVPFNAMSSGENIIMALTIALSFSEGADELKSLPEVLLLDEIDAFLHPTMTSFLLKAIERDLVGSRNLKVIMTTHSPSTVALASEESLYELKKDGLRKILCKIPKDRGINLLTSGVPTLSVTFQNRRQVFVESEFDAEYFDAIFQRLSRHSDVSERFSGVSLSFLSSGGSVKGAKSGSCNLVQDYVSRLRDGGNETVFGIIDWDLENEYDL